jgi:hypothetical protein
MDCVTANYILAFQNTQNINSDVTITLVSTILGTVSGYFIKSYNEKNSRNKYQVTEPENETNSEEN